MKRIAPGVQINEVSDRKTGNKRLTFCGVSTCKSALCPLCVPALMRARCEEIIHAINVWGAMRTWFITFTIRHNSHMRLMLLHRVLTIAFGNLFSGRRGGVLSRLLGGSLTSTPPPPGLPDAPRGRERYAKPHSIRAHDRTFSAKHRWHPHLHALMFTHTEDLTEASMLELLTARWKECAAGALKQIKDVVLKAYRTGLDESDPGYLPETPALRSRCEKLLGKRTFRPGRSLAEAARPLVKALQSMSETAIVPLDQYAVRVERVRQPGRAAQYLSKLGCELSGMGRKQGHTVIENGSPVEHFGLWELASIACTHGHELRQVARAAWSELYHGTFGTQTLTFSQGARKAFGFGDRPSADSDVVQEAATVTEDTQLLGGIDGEDWDRLSKEQRHGLLATIYAAHKMGVLGELPYVQLGYDPLAKEPVPLAHMSRPVVRTPPEPAPPVELLEARGRARSRAPPEKPPDPPYHFEPPAWVKAQMRQKLREQVAQALSDVGVDVTCRP